MRVPAAAMFFAVAVAVAVGVAAAACSTPSVTAPERSVATATTTAPSTSVGVLAEVRAQLEQARTVVCELVAAVDVQEAFGEPATLTTAPMGGANGPACGYPHPRHGGYLFVVQFQDLARWEQRVRDGRSLDDIGSPAVVSADGAQIAVRDDKRGVLTLLTAPDRDAAGAAAILRIAARIYPPGGGVAAPAACGSPSPFTGSELVGSAGDAQLHGLVSLWPLRAGPDVKIVWRMTGTGDLTATATGPAGEAAVRTFGPEPHAWSTYDRPGDEWGTGWRFPTAGCWHLRLTRADAQGDVWVTVVA